MQEEISVLLSIQSLHGRAFSHIRKLITYIHLSDTCLTFNRDVRALTQKQYFLAGTLLVVDSMNLYAPYKNVCCK